MARRSGVRDERAVAAFVERLGSVFTASGLPRLPSRVFAALLADEHGRLTAAELAEALAVSPAAVSGAVRYLEQVHMIHRERERGSRRDVFVVVEDAWQDVMLSHDQVYPPIRDAMAAGIGAVGGVGTEAGARLELSIAFLDFIGAELDGIAARWASKREELVRARS